MDSFNPANACQTEMAAQPFRPKLNFRRYSDPGPPPPLSPSVIAWISAVQPKIQVPYLRQMLEYTLYIS